MKAQSCERPRGEKVWCVHVRCVLYSKRFCLRNQQIEISRWLEPGKSAGNRNQRDISMRRASSAKKILAISAKNLEIGWLAQKWRFLSQDLLLYRLRPCAFGRCACGFLRQSTATRLGRYVNVCTLGGVCGGCANLTLET